MRNKVISSEEAAQLVKSGDSVALSGFISMGHPDELTNAVVKRFQETGEPRNLTLIAGAGMRSTDKWAKEGLVRKIIASHTGRQPTFIEMIINNKVEAYFYPYGAVVHAIRAAAGKKPGILTKVGLGTFIDPRYGAGKMNSCSNEEMVELIDIHGEEYLYYHSFPISVALLKATTADERGNLSTEKEALALDMLSIATAAKANNGIVIAQVERLAAFGTLHPKSVKVPGIIVDAIVLAKPENHWQTGVAPYEPGLSGEMKIPLSSLPKLAFNERKIICRRCAMEMHQEIIINLGAGMPDGVGAILAEEGLSEEAIPAIEAGTIGGVAQGGLRFGCTMNSEAHIEIGHQLDLIDAGILDIAVMGLAEVDRKGNVNVSKFGKRIVGPGGFIDIVQNTKEVIFCGTFTVDGLKIATEDGKLQILNEGCVKKFLKDVSQITFSGEFAQKSGQKVLYVTERAVFELGAEGITLIEIAPGIDLEKHIFSQMEFRPSVAKEMRTMDPRIFGEEPMGIKEEIMARKEGYRIGGDYVYEYVPHFKKESVILCSLMPEMKKGPLP